MKRLILLGHLGLGDHIITNGLVRVLLKDYEHIEIITKRHNAPTVGWMFSDTGRVSCLCVENDDEARKLAAWEETKGQKVLRLGVHTGDYTIPKDWDVWMYRQAGIPHECRWTEFGLPWQTLPKFTPHWPIFIHDDPARKYSIAMAAPRNAIYRPSAKEPFQNHIRPLQSADEIHVIDSCFLALADSIPTHAKRHALHLYATAHDPYKKFGPPTLRKDWEILR